jgi:hypothetical protein
MDYNDTVKALWDKQFDPELDELIDKYSFQYRPEVKKEPDQDLQELSELNCTVGAPLTEEGVEDIAGYESMKDVAKTAGIPVQEKRPKVPILTRTPYDPNRLRVDKKLEKRVSGLEKLIADFRQQPCFKSHQGDEWEGFWKKLTSDAFECVQSALA